MNLDCIIDRGVMSPVYANLIGVASLPIIMCILTFVVWTPIKLCAKGMTWSDYQQYLKGTLVNILFILHPTILQHSMIMFTCTTIDNTSYLDTYMEDECWTGDHWTYATAVAIPSFLLWGIGLPFMAFRILVKKNKAETLWDQKCMKKYGFLYLGFNRKKYWWSFVILTRKVFILANLIWLSQISTVVQALTAIAFLWFCIYL